MTNQLDIVFGALADPTRRAVVEQLTRGPAAVSALHDGHDMALPTFLKHLKVLEESGLVSSTKKGRVRTVHIEAAPLRVMDDWLKRQKDMWEGRLDRLARLAETLNEEDST
ncbi:metalloregulator ArsR/SmtB family transcription factor [Tateyamaria omphalii]|uniref:ArsR/SmtB family transcription factor n=1 Tax=Tateyamaria omphalii TaxID=299262 RepID=UPI001C99F4AD|nr:metalloregulator ArsR/SmtB family transcription factor [Tateyamaria omphalii]MBY5935214.1 metalloregulator ArsR/SmtB family transcription factor [Tateyamaria omphalii]